MNRLRWVVALLAMVMFSMLVSAAEAVETVSGPVWYGDVRLWEILASIVVVVWGIVKVKYKLDERMNAQAVGFLEMGVHKTYDEFVRAAKASNPKHKLTDEQVELARDKAFEFAKNFARAKGVDLVKKIALERVPVLITGIVNKLKKKR